MPDSNAYEPRSASQIAAEERYLRHRLEQIEKGLGTVAARLAAPAPAGPSLLALDRARQLAGELLAQIRVRTLEEAITARLEWLDRAAARRKESAEPLPRLDLTDLDRRLLTDLLAAWRSADR